jgi:hypothetical protein
VHTILVLYVVTDSQSLAIITLAPPPDELVCQDHGGHGASYMLNWWGCEYPRIKYIPPALGKANAESPLAGRVTSHDAYRCSRISDLATPGHEDASLLC